MVSWYGKLISGWLLHIFLQSCCDYNKFPGRSSSRSCMACESKALAAFHLKGWASQFLWLRKFQLQMQRESTSGEDVFSRFDVDIFWYILCKASKTGDAVRIECPGLDRSSCSCGYCGCCAFGLWLMTTAGACHRTQAVMYGHALRSLCDCFVSWTVSLQVLLQRSYAPLFLHFLAPKNEEHKHRKPLDSGFHPNAHERYVHINDLCSGLVAL